MIAHVLKCVYYYCFKLYMLMRESFGVGFEVCVSHLCMDDTDPMI